MRPRHIITMHDPDAPNRSRPAPDMGDRGTLANFMASLPATVWTTDRRLVVTFVQGVYLRRLQIDPARLIGRTVQDIVLDGREDHPLVQGHLTALDGHDTTVRVEWGGRLFSVRLAPLRDPDGRIVGCVGINLEIGWLPEVDDTLRESDVRLQRVVDANILGIAFGNDEGHITEANDAFLQLVGCSRDDLADETISWPALLPVEAHQRQIQALDEILSTGRCAPFETEIVRRDGRRVPVLVGAARLSAQRREGVAFVLDITDRKRAVRALRAELACADCLAVADAPAAAADGILHALVEARFCRSAALWLAAGDGAALTSCGAAREDAESFAIRVMQTGQEHLAPEREILALPLIAGDRCRGALIVASWVNGEPEQEILDACRRIAQRVATFLSRRP